MGNQNYGTGTTMAFTTSIYVFQITSLKHSGQKREAIKTTHMGTTGAHTYIPGALVENGEYDVSGYYDPEKGVPMGLSSGTTEVGETVTITFPKLAAQTTGPTRAYTGFIIESSESVEIDKMMTQDFKIKVTGLFTDTAHT